MKQFRCGDVVPGCTSAFVGTDDEILGQVAAHARTASTSSAGTSVRPWSVRAAIRPL